MVSLTLQQSRVITADNRYAVTNTVATSDGIPPEIFVYTFDTGVYSHIATTGDLRTVPTVPDRAAMFYRTAVMTLTFSDPRSAVDAADRIKVMVEELVSIYGKAVREFEGADTNTYTG